jgi:hypothetical protein
MSAFNFNANQEAPDAGRMGPVAAGWYAVMVKKLEHGVTGGGDGEKINAQLEICEGPHKGQSVFHNFNMKNASETAEKIGRGQFSALCHATNQLVIQQLEQLYSIPFKVKLKVSNDPTGQYEPKNEVTAFKQYNDPAAVNTTAVAAVAGPALVKPPAIPVANTPMPPANPGATWAATAPPAGAPAMAPQPWAQPAGAPAAMAPPPPAPAPAPAPAPTGPIYTMTAAANGATREAYLAIQGWTDELLVSQGLMVVSGGAPAPAAPPPPAPVGSTPSPVSGPAVAPLTPPWMTAPAQ